MTIKLAVLKNGENLISDIKEAYYENELKCYIFDNPCSVIINSSYTITDGEDLNKNSVNITLYPWPALSSDTSVQVSTDSIVTIVEPNTQLKEIYQDRNTKND